MGTINNHLSWQSSYMNAPYYSQPAPALMIVFYGSSEEEPKDGEETWRLKEENGGKK